MDIDWQRFFLEARAGREATAFIRCLEEEIARLRLTDEEREAVKFFSQIDGPGNVPVANKRAAALRGLLERLQ